MEVQNLNVNAITIPEFFSGLSVFITGGSGFMGKVRNEKQTYYARFMMHSFLIPHF